MSCSLAAAQLAAALIVVLLFIAILIYGRAGCDGFRSKTRPYCDLMNECVGCMSHAECLGTLCAGGVCVECTTQDVSRCAADRQQCSGDDLANGSVGRCAACYIDSAGVSQGCPASQKCVGSGAAATCANCAVDADCPISGIDHYGRPAPGACVAGVCVECRDGSNCPAYAPHCGGNRCYTCRSDGDCRFPLGHCDTSVNGGPRGVCTRKKAPPVL
jgi:hypothetical protein